MCLLEDNNNIDKWCLMTQSQLTLGVKGLLIQINKCNYSNIIILTRAWNTRLPYCSALSFRIANSASKMSWRNCQKILNTIFLNIKRNLDPSIFFFFSEKLPKTPALTFTISSPSIFSKEVNTDGTWRFCDLHLNNPTRSTTKNINWKLLVSK